MPKSKKPQKIFLFHKNVRGGAQFDISEAQNRYEELVEAGWVDSPAKLEPLPPVKLEEIAADPTINIVEMVNIVKTAGFHVLNDIELAGLVSRKMGEMQELYENQSQAQQVTPHPTDALFNRYIQSPSSFVKAELIGLGNQRFGLELTDDNLKEEMIFALNQEIARLP